MRLSFCLAALLPLIGSAQRVELVEVQSNGVERNLKLPGELLPWETVEVRARVPGYVERIDVDRGSRVRKGQAIARLHAPEMSARVAEAEARVQAAQSEIAEAEARLAGAQAAYHRIKAASATAGAVAGIELVRAEKEVAAAQAFVRSKQRGREAADAAADAVRRLQAYLNVTAPFAGTVTERLVHPGALVGPDAPALVRLEQLARLRLVVQVPESAVGGIRRGQRVSFRVPAYPAQSFPATVARIPNALDPKTRSMAVEFDVSNSTGRLAPGMYPEVALAVRTPSALLVPPSAVATTTERTFVIRSNGGRAEYVNVRKGAPAGELIEVFGALSAGDRVVRRASDEIREGSRL